jgi:hypothetical protein
MLKIPLTANLHNLPGIAGTVGLNPNASFNISLTDGLSGMGCIPPSMRMRVSRKAILDVTMQRLGRDGQGNLRTHQGCNDYIWCIKPCTCIYALNTTVQTVSADVSHPSSQEWWEIAPDCHDNINIDGDYPIISCSNQVGDMNGDGLFDYNDIAMIANLILQQTTEGYVPNDAELFTADLTGAGIGFCSDEASADQATCEAAGETWSNGTGIPDGNIDIPDISYHIDCLTNYNGCDDIPEDTNIEVEQTSNKITVEEAVGSTGGFNVVYLEVDCPANGADILPTEQCEASYVVQHISGHPHFDENAMNASNRSFVAMIVCEPTSTEIATFNVGACTAGPQYTDAGNCAAAGGEWTTGTSPGNLHIRNLNTSNRTGLATTIEDNTIIQHNYPA